MPRRVQDIRPAEKRTIREIPVKKPVARTGRPRKSESSPVESEEPSALVEEIPEEISINRLGESPLRMPITPPYVPPRPRRKFRFWMYTTLVVLVAIVGAGYFASVYYSQATFTVVPKVIPVAVNGTYVAQPNSSKTEDLLYEVITVKSSASTTVPATSGPKISTKATGKVTLYNAYSATTARLIVGTRLASDNGLVYRLTGSVVIPGYTKSGATIVPGKLTASVVADQPGQEYNVTIDSTNADMNIVAYKGTERYDKIYAKAVGSFSGGFVGTKKIIASSDSATAAASLKSTLTTTLLDKAAMAVPEGYVMYDGSHSIVFGSQEIGDPSPTTASISEQATLYGIIFKKNNLIDTVAGSSATGLFGKYDFSAPGLDSLDVTITNLKDFSPTKKVSLVAKIKGSLKLVGTVPADEIKQKLSGLTLAETQDVFKEYSAVIESGSGELAPPWAKIPSNLDRIKIVVEKP